MSMTQFAMVEELASLIKDNLFSKHLVLSTEEALIRFLQDDTSVEGVLELQPMSPYHRLLLHRLADIYGFAHKSVGEGDDRHLVLERCLDSAIPTILIGDILWQYDECQSPASSQHILIRKDSPAREASETPLSSTPFEEREAAYLAARERIFSLHLTDEKEAVAPKSRNIPVASRRMIAHALGKKIEPSNNMLSVQKCEASKTIVIPSNGDTNYDPVLSAPTANEKTAGAKKSSLYEKKSSNKSHGGSCDVSQAHIKASSSICSNGEVLVSERSGRVVGTANQERDQIGAAKRIFAHALGLSSTKGSLSLAAKSHGRNRSFSRDT